MEYGQSLDKSAGGPAVKNHERGFSKPEYQYRPASCDPRQRPPIGPALRQNLGLFMELLAPPPETGDRCSGSFLPDDRG